jgi:hypothetical protein
VSAVDRVAAALARAGVDAEIREYPVLAYDVVWAVAGTPRAVFPIAPGALVEVSGGRVARVRPD